MFVLYSQFPFNCVYYTLYSGTGIQYHVHGSPAPFLAPQGPIGPSPYSELKNTNTFSAIPLHKPKYQLQNYLTFGENIPLHWQPWK